MKPLDLNTSPCSIVPGQSCEIQAKRSLAKKLGHTHYFSGKTCAKGHIAQRRVANGGCQTCLNERTAAWRAANVEKARDATARWRNSNRESLLKTRKAFRESPEGKEKLATQRASLYAKNPEKHQQRGREFYHENLEDCAERNRIYRKSIPGFDRERGAKRRAALLQAMPVWADRAAIKKIYADCPAGMHVDHFVPLHGLLPGGMSVCGLHVPNNLRHLSASKNSARKNRMSAADVADLERTYEAA